MAQPCPALPMATLDEQIAQGLRAALSSGELRSAPSWGRPLALDDGFDETPLELRLPFKILKDAGYVPHEVALMREIAALREQLAALHDTSSPAAQALLRRLAGQQQLLALRLERLRLGGSL